MLELWEENNADVYEKNSISIIKTLLHAPWDISLAERGYKRWGIFKELIHSPWPIPSPRERITADSLLANSLSLPFVWPLSRP